MKKAVMRPKETVLASHLFDNDEFNCAFMASGSCGKRSSLPRSYTRTRTTRRPKTSPSVAGPCARIDHYLDVGNEIRIETRTAPKRLDELLSLDPEPLRAQPDVWIRHAGS
jgi:hypothetical protein